MGYDIVVAFRKVFVKCNVLNCKNKHYAKGYCEHHYNLNCRTPYRYSSEEYQKIQSKKQLCLEEPVKTKEKSTLYQKLKELGISYFSYKDAMKATNWKYRKVQKHVLKLVALNKVFYNKHSPGGRKKEAFFILK